MSRQLSAVALASAHAAQTGEVWLLLVTITHADLPAPVRIVNDVNPITSRGNEFIACPFRVLLPAEASDTVGEVQIAIDNVDTQIGRTMRALAEPPRALIEIILASQPDTVEMSIPDLTLRNIEGNASEVRGTLRFEALVVEPVAETITPDAFPALF